jgi:hypothetical protein
MTPTGRRHRYVQDALDRYALILDDSDVTVDADGNTVTLSGLRQRRLADGGSVARAMAGIP